MTGNVQTGSQQGQAAVSPPAERRAPRFEHRVVAVVHALLAALLLGGVFVALPARWAPVDVAASVLAGGAFVSSAALFARKRWAVQVARVVCWAWLGSGALCVTALAFSAAHLAGSYGPVGGGGALLMTIVALLVLPYLVMLPALQLRWLARSGTPG